MNYLKIYHLNEFSETSKKLWGAEEGFVAVKNDISYMIKKMNIDRTIGEYVGSNIAHSFLPTRAPEVFLAKDDNNVIFNASKFINNFEDFFSAADSGKDISNITGIDERNIIARFLHHNDESDGNFGFIINNNIKEAAVIDFSRSLKFLDDHILYTTFKMADEDKITLTPETTKTLKKISEINILQFETSIDNLFITLNEAYKHDYEYLSKINDEKNYIKNQLIDRIDLCEKELLVIEFLESLNSSKFFSADHTYKLISHTSLDNELGKYIKHFINDMTLNDFGHFKDVISYLSPFIYKDCSLLKGLIFKVIKSHNKEYFDFLFDLMRPYHKLMKDTLYTIVKEDIKDFFESILPYYKEVPESISDALYWTVTFDNKEYFSAILPFMHETPQFMEEAFLSSVLSKNKEFFDAMLPFMEKDCQYMIKAFKYAFKYNKKEYIEAMLTSIAQNSKCIEKAFDIAINDDWINEDENYFDSILQYMNCDVIEAKLSLCFIENTGKYDYFIKEMLPYVSDVTDGNEMIDYPYEAIDVLHVDTHDNLSAE